VAEVRRCDADRDVVRESWLLRLVVRLLPSSWRETVRADLEEEVRRTERAGVRALAWATWQTTTVALKLRPAMIGDSTMSDVKFALRRLRKSPAFTLSAVLTLGLGLGLNVAVFSVADGMLFKPLPYGDADSLVMIHGWNRRTQTAHLAVPAQVVDAVRTGATSVEAIAVSDGGGQMLAGEGTAFRTVTASSNVFDVLRVRPLHGRTFAPGDEATRPIPVLLSGTTWRGRFGSDVGIIGRTLTLPGRTIQVIGILPDRLLLPGRPPTVTYDLVLPSPSAASPSGRGALAPFGRLRPGASVAAADTELNQILDRTKTPRDSVDAGVRVSPIRFGLTELRRPAVITLMVAAALVLIVATANIVNLFLFRGFTRRGELAVRVALGGARWRLGRMLALEAALVTIVGGAIAVVIAVAAFDAIADAVPPDYRVFMPERVDWRTLAFAASAMAVATLACAITGAFQGSRVDLRPMLDQRGRGGPAGGVTPGRFLLGAQSMIAAVVLIGAAFMVTSFHRLSNVDLGFEPEGLSYGSLLGPVAKESPENFRARFNQLMDRVSSIHGIRVAAADALPFTGEGPLEGLGTESRVSVGLRGVSSEFLDVHGLRLADGRWPTPTEFAQMAPAGVISRSGAAALFPGRSALGQVVHASRNRTFTIMGMVDDVRPRQNRPGEAEVFVPLDFSSTGDVRFLVRSSLPATAAAARLAEVTQALSPGAPAVVLTPVEVALDPALRLPRLIAVVFALFGVIVLIVSAVGIAGLLLYLVEQRRFEIGVRLALGASRGVVARFVAAAAFLPVALGLVAGLGIAWWIVRYVQSLLFDLRMDDVRLYLAGALVLLALAALAAWIPARRASRIDPLIVMRSE
jgi:putative ABC transport system permease protein